MKKKNHNAVSFRTVLFRQNSTNPIQSNSWRRDKTFFRCYVTNVEFRCKPAEGMPTDKSRGFVSQNKTEQSTGFGHTSIIEQLRQKASSHVTPENEDQRNLHVGSCPGRIPSMCSLSEMLLNTINSCRFSFLSRPARWLNTPHLHTIPTLRHRSLAFVQGTLVLRNLRLLKQGLLPLSLEHDNREFTWSSVRVSGAQGREREGGD